MREMTTKEVQQFSLSILQEFHDFCIKNNLHYSLSGGTLLGAIRHNGFIPWDDDIDVQMPRPDYDKFIYTFKSDKGLKVFCRELLDEEGLRIAYPYARLCDTSRTYVDTGIRPWIDASVGMWIDILPCDGAPNDEIKAVEHIEMVGRYVRKTWRTGVRYTSWSVFLKGNNVKEKFKFIAKKIVSPFETYDPYRKLCALRKQFDYSKSNYFFTTPHYGIKEWQLKKNMESFILHKFEEKEFYIMSGWDANLKSLFGDYMKLPPENKRISHDFNRYYWKN